MTDSETRETLARAAAERWLAHVDAGDAAAAWEESSVAFRKAVSPTVSPGLRGW